MAGRGFNPDINRPMKYKINQRGALALKKMQLSKSSDFPWSLKYTKKTPTCQLANSPTR
jgi:hypothetical protein